ncbi:hypothetical protein ACTXJY_07310, partial [Corynebacterium casei]
KIIEYRRKARKNIMFFLAFLFVRFGPFGSLGKAAKKRAKSIGSYLKELGLIALLANPLMAFGDASPPIQIVVSTIVFSGGTYCVRLAP